MSIEKEKSYKIFIKTGDIVASRWWLFLLENKFSNKKFLVDLKHKHYIFRLFI